MTIAATHALSLLGSLAGAAAVMAWRVQEARRAVTLKKIVIPPMGMAMGFTMFALPGFRVPWSWALLAFLAGFVALAYPLLRTSRLERQGTTVLMRRSNAFFAVLIGLAIVRLAARQYLDALLTVSQTAGLFFILAFGMIVRWRANMLRQYRTLRRDMRG